MPEGPTGAAEPLASLPEGARVPPETGPHERTLLAWPTSSRREQLWGGQLDAARDVHALVAHTIARFEPVLLVVDPADEETAAAQVGGDAIELVTEPIDDSWLRDSGPVTAVARDGIRHALCFRFTGWGGSFTPFGRDATIAARLAEHLGFVSYDVGIAGEGGAVALDGEGIVVTTERCLLNPNRNPGRSRAEIDTALLRARPVRTPSSGSRTGSRRTRGPTATSTTWSRSMPPGGVSSRGAPTPRTRTTPSRPRAGRRSNGPGSTSRRCRSCRTRASGGCALPVPYVNLSPVNGAVLVPITGDPADPSVLELIAGCFPDRDVIGLPGAVLAYGGGGVHCITQPVPA